MTETTRLQQWSDLIDKGEALRRETLKERVRLAAYPAWVRPAIRWMLIKFSRFGKWIADVSREEAARAGR